MAKFKTPLYYCFECKKILEDFDQLFFVDEHSQKTFCSEECIEDFHLPIVKHFHKESTFLREKYFVADELIDLEVSRSLIDEIFARPDEVFRFSNELAESFYHVIKNINNKATVIIIASLFRGEASYIFGTVVTNNQFLIDEYRQGESIDLSSWMGHKQVSSGEPDQTEIDESEDLAFLQLLENKKSSLLATLLVKRKDHDISIESFVDYDFCFQETLERPDEVFEFKDKEGDVFFHYIKNYGLGERKEDNFFYIVICLKRKMADVTQTTVYPILGMPTNDMSLVHEFGVGKQISGPLKN